MAAACRRPGHGNLTDMEIFAIKAEAYPAAMPSSLESSVLATRPILPDAKTSHQGKTAPEKTHQHRLAHHDIQDSIEEVIREGLRAPQSNREHRTGQSKGSAHPMAKPVQHHSNGDKENRCHNLKRQQLRSAALAVDATHHRNAHPIVVQLPSPIESHVQQQSQLHAGQDSEDSPALAILTTLRPTHQTAQQRDRVRCQSYRSSHRKPLGDHALCSTL